MKLRLLAHLFFISCLLLLAPGMSKAEQIASYQDLAAFTSGRSGCTPNIAVTVQAPDASAYSGDRIALQYLLGGIRANFADCANLQSLTLTGLANGKVSFYGIASAQNGWKLVPKGRPRKTGAGSLRSYPEQIGSTSPPSADCTTATCQHVAPSVTAAQCEFDTNDPFIACWLLVAPVQFAGFILNIHYDHTWYEGRAKSLASGAPGLVGEDIQRGIMYGAGAGADITLWDGSHVRNLMAGPFLKFITQDGFQPWTGPYFHDDCNLMELMPYELMGIDIFHNGAPQVFVRLRPKVITVDLLQQKPAKNVDEAVPANPNFTYCPDNLAQALPDQAISRNLQLALPIMAGLSIAAADELLPSPLIRSGDAGSTLETAEEAGAGATVAAREEAAGAEALASEEASAAGAASSEAVAGAGTAAVASEETAGAEGLTGEETAGANATAAEEGTGLAGGNSSQGAFLNTGSANSHIYESTEPVGDILPQLDGLNPYYKPNSSAGANTNCVSCANAVNARLTGADPSAVAAPSNEYQSYTDLDAAFWSGPVSVQDVTTFMKSLPSGTTRILVVDQGTTVSHAINVLNDGGKIIYIDGQSGNIVTLNPTVRLNIGYPTYDAPTIKGGGP